MSLVGLHTVREKQVWSGRLHVRLIQCHLKRHWHVPESLDKVIPLPHSFYPHLDWWLNERNMLWGQPLHPLQHALQVFNDALNKGWGTHYKRRLVTNRKSPHKFSGAESSFSGPQEFRASLQGLDCPDSNR